MALPKIGRVKKNVRIASVSQAKWFGELIGWMQTVQFHASKTIQPKSLYFSGMVCFPFSPGLQSGDKEIQIFYTMYAFTESFEIT